RLKCVFLTGYDNFSYAKRAIHLNAFDYLLKPVDDCDIEECARRAIQTLEDETRQILEVQYLRDKLEKSMESNRCLLMEELLENGQSYGNLSLTLQESLNQVLSAGSPVHLTHIRVNVWGSLSGADRGRELEHMIQTMYRELGGNAILSRYFMKTQTISAIFQEDNSLTGDFLLGRFEKIQDMLYNNMGVLISFAMAYALPWDALYEKNEYFVSALRENRIPGKVIYGTVEKRPEEGEQQPYEQLISSIHEYIATYLDGDLSLDQISRKYRINPCYLSRLYRNVTGGHLSSYINAQRILIAKKLLLDKKHKIYDIAQRVGFQNPNYFAKVFRKSVGVSPQEFRLAAGIDME
ncbi:MAG: helix-turn-helix domain-containing protein, partial [Clostridiales bacterium]|nr:helix-turn-helix domain-containing protein [Clostridiales bacterium]